MPYTKLDGVNRALTAIGYPPVGSLDPAGPAGSSVQAQAERMLEFTTKRVLRRGFNCNRIPHKKFTLAAPGTINFAAVGDVCSAIPSGPTERRLIEMRASLAWDMENNTSTFPIGDYFFTLHVWLSFDDTESSVQEIIMEECAKLFQQAMVNNPTRDQSINEHLAKAEVLGKRPTPAPNTQPTNMQPLIPAGGGNG